MHMSCTCVHINVRISNTCMYAACIYTLYVNSVFYMYIHIQMHIFIYIIEDKKRTGQAKWLGTAEASTGGG